MITSPTNARHILPKQDKKEFNKKRKYVGFISPDHSANPNDLEEDYKLINVKFIVKNYRFE
jgi:hypothetical protein